MCETIETLKSERDAALRSQEEVNHPVATRETVERVAKALFEDRKRVVTIRLDWSELRGDLRETHRIAARAALTAAGFTLEAGA